MTKPQSPPLTKQQLDQIKALAATMLECSQHLERLLNRRHPSTTDAEFMIQATRKTIHSTLKHLGIET